MLRFRISFAWFSMILLISMTAGACSLFRGGGGGTPFPSLAPSRIPSATPTGEADEVLQVQQTVLEAVRAQREESLGMLVYQVDVRNVTFSQDGQWSAAWMVYQNQDTGEDVPIEPGLTLLQRAPGGWEVVLPADPGFMDALEAAPNDLVSEEIKQVWREWNADYQLELPTSALSGYLLPWAAGNVASLSQSVAHDRYTPSGNAHYAFDFYIPQTMFNLYAAKGGTVWMAKDDVPNNDHSGVGNYLVLKDTSTSPTTYQLYLHLAQGSIPPGLHTPGEAVVQGQLIGIVDNTGQSSGQHLHFQVHTNPDSYWGRSVDIVFADVAINGGRPRVKNVFYDDQPWCRPDDVCVQFQTDYISGNVVKGDVIAPAGGIAGIDTGSTLQAGSLILAGWGVDTGSGFYSAQLVARYGNGPWLDIGPASFETPFIYDWDLCASGVPDGVVSLALRVFDQEGNQNPLAGLRHFVKEYACPQPPPACQPDANQVALYAYDNYDGSCSVFNAGDYADGISLGAVGDNDAASIRVGANVQATLYSLENFQGRSQTLPTDDPGLADNWIGRDTLSALKVSPKTQPPVAPQPIWPPDRQVISATQSLSLYWLDGGGSLEYQVRLIGSTGSAMSDWQAEPYLSLGTALDNLVLDVGAYRWQVRARDVGGEGPWSPVTRAFTVAAMPPQTPIVKTVPFMEDFEAGGDGWSATGLWHLATDPSPSHSLTHSEWFGESENGDEGYFSAKQGSLTSPQVDLPAGENLSLRFWYYYQTETQGRDWDQRWVQLSVDDGPFFNLLQLSDDPMEVWISSPFMDLSAYAGHSVRVRFYFDTIDPSYHSPDNDFAGWYIDDVQITSDSEPSCNDPAEPNNSPTQASPLAYSQSPTNGIICPPGDEDYFVFNATQGDRIVVDVDAQSIGSNLDPYLYLLDADGKTILAQNDDEVIGQSLDPHLGFVIPRTGIYYLKLRAWDNPGAGGPDFNYRLRLFTDAVNPSVQLTAPVENSYLPNSTVSVSAQANDPLSGISRVEFYWHSGEWLNAYWQLVGTDRDGSDGWQVDFNAAPLPDQHGGALYAQAVDWAGNTAISGVWNVGVDHTPPASMVRALPSEQDSTAINVRWEAADSGSGLQSFDLQVMQDGSGTWQDFKTNLNAMTRQAWYIGFAGHVYAFRVRAVDAAGNRESYPSAADASTTIPAPNVFCAHPDILEGSTNDNAFNRATPILPNGPAQVHNFCNPAAASRLNDEDWISFAVQYGRHYLIQALPESPQAAAIIELFDSDGETLISHVSAGDLGRTAALGWDSDRTGIVYVRIHHLNGSVAGNGVVYQVRVLRDYRIFMPVQR